MKHERRRMEVRINWRLLQAPHADRLPLIYKNRQNTEYYIGLRETAAGCNTYIPTHTHTHTHSCESEFIPGI